MSNFASSLAGDMLAMGWKILTILRKEKLKFNLFPWFHEIIFETHSVVND